MKQKKLVIVTGGSGGLGNKVCQALSDKHDVISVDKQPSENLQNMQISFDISTYRLYENIPSEDILNNRKVCLVLCAGVLGKTGGILDADFADWEKTIKVNLLGNLATIKAFLPQMIKTQYGRIVFIAGGGAAYGYPLFSGYSMSKVATVRAVENIAMEMRDKIKDFSIVALAPGAMETKMLEQVRLAGAEIRTTVDIQEPVNFIDNFLDMKKEKATKLSGRFVHVRDDLNKRRSDKKWMLRRIE